MAARRKRCAGPCKGLFDPSELSPVDAVGYVCQDCMLKVAEGLLDEQGDTQMQPPEVDAGLIRRVVTEEDVELIRRMSGDEAAAEAGTKLMLIDALDRPALSQKPERWRQLPNVKVPGWPLRYGRVSASALATFARCPEQFRLQNVLNMKQPQAGAPLTGSAVHGAMENQWQRRIEQGVDATESEVRNAYHETFEALSEKAGGMGEVDWSNRAGDRDTAAKWRSAGERVTLAYHGGPAKTVVPVAFEDIFTAYLPGVPVPVVGYLDLVTTEQIIDVKVGGRAHREPNSEWRMQGLIYMLSEYRLPMGWHSLAWPKKDGEVSMAQTGLPLTAERYQIAVMLVRRYVRAILAYTAAFGTEQPWPGNLNHSWACQTCAFRDQGVCEWWHPTLDTLF